MRPENKRHRIPETVRLFDAGIGLMDRAKEGTTSPKRRVVQYRNGLMGALLSLCPIRLKNFSALSIDGNFG